MNLTARSVMTNPVVAVSPETSLADVHRLFVEEGIHTGPRCWRTTAALPA